MEVANAERVDNLRTDNSEKNLHVTAHPHPHFLPDVALKQTMVVLVPNLPTFGYRYSSTRCEKVDSDCIRALLLDHLGEQVLQLG